MPYQNISDLPLPIKNHLPVHAQEIYLAAFNNAWNQYKAPQKRAREVSQEVMAHKVAWAAVKKKYFKAGDNWKKKDKED
jgi:cation transport regulator